ncbi:MAG TPA: hypothetical protein DCS28_03320 [Candidatus Moranbacteria bacterium]|nr:hypothetical protein [Candidatus Moranbacteria bacterium]HAT75042.1 hypothetical protein [Candidatus Moranbacteria bacterium]
MPNSLSKKILSTIAYYDILDYPLTVFETWKYLIGEQQNKKINLREIILELETDEVKKNIESYRGYYFLRGRKDSVKQRIERNKISEGKYKIARRAVWFLRFAPFVRMILVTGRLAMKNVDKKSDIDFLVCLESGHIFIGRTFVTLITHLLGKRRYGDKITNRICLNYFITASSLEIETQDLFASSEYFFAVPIFGFEYFQKFRQANGWIKKYHENYIPAEIANLKVIQDDFFSRLIRKVGELIFGFNFLEQKLKTWQTERIMNDPRTKKSGSLIIADDNSLVFLPDPQGPKVFEAFKKKMKLC